MADESFGFAAYEYLEGFRESLADLKNRAEDLRQLLDISPVDNYLFDFKNKANLVLELVLEYSDHNMDWLSKIKVLGKRDVEDAFLSYMQFDEYSSALRSVEKAISQRFGTAHNDTGFFPENAFGQSEARICNAVDRLVEKLSTLFFGTKAKVRREEKINNLEYQIIPMTIFGDSPKHDIVIHRLKGHTNVLLFMVNMPNPDVHRFRYWTSLGHELAHVKLTKTIQQTEQEKVEYITYLEEGQKTYDDITQRLYQGIGEAYKDSKIFGERYEANKPGYYRFIVKQVEEIIADLSSIAIFGLPSVLTLICSSGSPQQGLDDLCDHPPFPARVNYMLKVLRSFNNQTELYIETLNDVEKEWNAMSTDCNLEQYSSFLDHYNATIEGNLKSLFEFTCRHFVRNCKPIEPETWDDFVSMYEKDEDKLNSSCPDPVLSLVRAWAKRWVTYKKLVATGKGSFGDFSYWHKTETKIYGQLINELNRMTP